MLCDTPRRGADESQPAKPPPTDDYPPAPATVSAHSNNTNACHHSPMVQLEPNLHTDADVDADAACTTHSEFAAPPNVVKPAPAEQPDVEPGAGTPPHRAHHPPSPRRPAMPRALGPLQAPGSEDMPVDDVEVGQSTTGTPSNINPSPSGPQVCPEQPIYASQEGIQHAPTSTDGAAAGGATTTPSATRGASGEPHGPPRPDKRPHIPTGETPAPQRKMPPVPPQIAPLAPPSDADEHGTNPGPQTDHAPFWGYNLLAPRKEARYMQWNTIGQSRIK